MEQKHKQALEQYVESKLADNDKNDNKNTTVTFKEPNTSNRKLTEDELYKQIAETSEQMAGKTTSTITGESTTDGDVGTGGAMLVSGTGLAEVILPVEERIKAVQATQEASSSSNNKNTPRPGSNSYGGMPVSQVPVPGGAARFQVSGADRHRHFPGEQQNQQQQQANANNDTTATDETEAPALDQDRMGFDALRGKTATAGESYHGNNNNNGSKNNNNSRGPQQKRDNTRASDDKVYGNFLKHHRENQWRGGGR